MENLGWVKLHRSVLDSRIWASPEGLKIWMWILLKAHHSDDPLFCEMVTGKGKTTVKIFQGQFIFGRKVAAKELNLSEKVIRSWITKLASPEYDMILVQAKSHFSIIQIKNWRMYQVEKGPTKGQAKANQRPHTRMDKNDRMDNKPESQVLSTQAEIETKGPIQTDSILSPDGERSQSVAGNIPDRLKPELFEYNVLTEEIPFEFNIDPIEDFGPDFGPEYFTTS